MTHTPDRIKATLDYAEWANGGATVTPSDFPSDLAQGPPRFDISVQTTPERHDWYGGGWDVTYTDKSGQGWTISRRYYGIELSDAISDMLEQADAYRLGL